MLWRALLYGNLESRSNRRGGADLDAFAGTYVVDGFTLTFDGAGNGTFNNGSADFTFTYTVDGTTANISAVGDVWNADDNTATLGDGTVTISWNDEYMENPLNKTFTKQAEVQLDAFAGTYTADGGFTMIFNGDGTGTFDNGTVYNFTYQITVEGHATLSDFAAWDDGENTADLSGSTLQVHLSGSFGDDVVNKTFTKQA